jgi:hypothetical protein
MVFLFDRPRLQIGQNANRSKYPFVAVTEIRLTCSIIGAVGLNRGEVLLNKTQRLPRRGPILSEKRA